MRRITRTINDLALKPWLALLGTICSILGLVLWAGERIASDAPSLVGPSLFILGLVFFLSIHAFSIFARRENVAFRNMVYQIHRINHEYRDTLHDLFITNGQAHSLDPRQVITREERTLRSVCQRISRIYTSLLSGHVVVVTIKLIRRSEPGKHYCETYVRSEENSERDESPPRHYSVGTGDNKAFDEALRYPQPGKCSNFHAADLGKQPDYNNQRPHWSNFYRSTIVVPIRRMDCNRTEHRVKDDDIGFLCIDTKTVNNLNSGYHVELLAGFADQVYNFISLTRGRYRVGTSA